MIETNEPSDKDVTTLQKLILEMVKTITHLSKDSYLIGLVGSCFDVQSAEVILRELQAYNNGDHPYWLKENEN